VLKTLSPIAALCGLAAAATAPARPAPPPAFKGSWQGPATAPAAPPRTASAQPAKAPASRSPRPYHVLVLGGTRGFHHDSASTAMAAVYRWGKETGLWESELTTDFTLVNAGGGEPMRAGFQPKGLRDFDAVVVANASGDWGLTADQQAALIAFVREQGKGLVVIHAGLDANHGWRGYLDMIGGEFVGHPFNNAQPIVDFPLVNEDPAFPATAHLPKRLRKQDELYIVRNFDRREVDVLVRLDESKLDFANVEALVPPDHDMAIAWAKPYGKGRVFAASFGHTKESFEDPEIARMYAEAIKWSLGLTDGDTTSHERR
jgi:type 1 glutamine amidotransferase